MVVRRPQDALNAGLEAWCCKHEDSTSGACGDGRGWGFLSFMIDGKLRLCQCSLVGVLDLRVDNLQRSLVLEFDKRRQKAYISVMQ